eukprot:m51a1_g12024 hypothetical protein (456) ;mRNA; f:922-2387
MLDGERVSRLRQRPRRFRSHSSPLSRMRAALWTHRPRHRRHGGPAPPLLGSLFADTTHSASDNALSTSPVSPRPSPWSASASGSSGGSPSGLSTPGAALACARPQPSSLPLYPAASPDAPLSPLLLDTPKRVLFCSPGSGTAPAPQGPGALLWLPFVARMLTLPERIRRAPLRASGVSSEWRVICQDPALLLEHALEGLGLDRSLPLGRFAGEDAVLLREVCTVAELVERLHEGDPEPSSSSSYHSFILSYLPSARTMRSLRLHIPMLLRGIEMHAAEFCGLDVVVELSLGPELVEAAEFALSCVRSLLKAQARLESALECYQPRMPGPLLFPLRIMFESEPKFAVFMDPVRNTVHVSSTEESFLVEHLPNAVRSLATFCSICGYCTSAAEVEARVRQLLGLAGVERNQALSDSEHSHCLFKLALYHEELGGRLEGLVIQPSTAFSFDRSNGVMW